MSSDALPVRVAAPQADPPLSPSASAGILPPRPVWLKSVSDYTTVMRGVSYFSHWGMQAQTAWA